MELSKEEIGEQLRRGKSARFRAYGQYLRSARERILN
jgi:hypothetical protein